jgi:hypothetical protein
MKRIKVVAAVLTVGVAFAVSLGARAMPISELQSSCTGQGGSFSTWTDYIELDDGTLEGFEWSTCTYTYSTHTYIETYTDGEHTGDCYKPRGGELKCNTGKAPEPTSTPAPTGPSDPRVGTTSGTYEQPTATTSPTTTATTSGTASR